MLAGLVHGLTHGLTWLGRAQKGRTGHGGRSTHVGLPGLPARPIPGPKERQAHLARVAMQIRTETPWPVVRRHHRCVLRDVGHEAIRLGICTREGVNVCKWVCVNVCMDVGCGPYVITCSVRVWYGTGCGTGDEGREGTLSAHARHGKIGMVEVLRRCWMGEWGGSHTCVGDIDVEDEAARLIGRVLHSRQTGL